LSKFGYMKRQLPDQPNLEHLKAQAKDLLREIRAHNPSARLHDAQFQLANEYGFASWPKLVERLEELRVSRASFDKVVQIVEHGIRGGEHARDARRAMGLHPRLANASAACAAVALDMPALKSQLTGHVQDPIGDLKLPAIVYACASPFGTDRPAEYVATIRYLLEQGADPDTRYVNPSYPEYNLSVLYAASGIIRSAAATKLLLDAGATPDDGESLYHATETSDHSCLRLLLEAGAKFENTNAVIHMLDREDMTGLNLLLEYGPDIHNPNALIHAMKRGRSQEIINRLLSAGADPDSTSHWLRARSLAFERGYELPGEYVPTEAERLLAACWRGDVDEANRLRAHHRELTTFQRKSLAGAIWAGRSELIETHFAGGFSHEDRDDSAGTPLHAACFAGIPASVEILLRHAPPLDDVKDSYNAIPLQWAMHASEHAPSDSPEADYVRIVEMMIEAGSPRPVRLFGSDPVRDLLLDKWPDLTPYMGD
jgi:ankyrin repeat protein